MSPRNFSRAEPGGELVDPGTSPFSTFVHPGGVSVLKSLRFPVLAGPQSFCFAMRVVGLTPTATVRNLIKTCFSQWRVWTLANLLEQTRAALTTAAAAPVTSIWKMKKEDLLEVARRELGLEPHQLEKVTVLEIREKIRQHRVENKAARDPLLQVPKGLSKMTVAELSRECEVRNIELEAIPSGSRGPSRAQMIIAIKEWVVTASGLVQSETDWFMDDTSADL